MDHAKKRFDRNFDIAPSDDVDDLRVVEDIYTPFEVTVL